MPWHVGSSCKSRRTPLPCQSSGFSRGQGQSLSLERLLDTGTTPWHCGFKICNTLLVKWHKPCSSGSEAYPRRHGLMCAGVRVSCLAQPVKANGQKGSPWDQPAHPSKAVPYSPSEGKGSELFPASCKVLSAKEMMAKYEQRCCHWEPSQWWAEPWAKDHKLNIPVKSAQQSVSEETSVPHCDSASEVFLKLLSKYISVCVFTRDAASTTELQLPIYFIILFKSRNACKYSLTVR